MVRSLGFLAAVCAAVERATGAIGDAGIAFVMRRSEPPGGPVWDAWLDCDLMEHAGRQ